MKILYATDGSDHSEGAGKFLTNFDLSPDDEIIVLHVIGVNPFMDTGEAYYANLNRVRREIAPKILDLATDALKAVTAKVRTLVEEGNPDRSIIREAEDSGADLIVMGAKGLKAMKSFFIGSVTRSVAINSPKPVLVVKPPQWTISGRLRVLLATDGSDHAKATARFLGSLPFRSDTELTILNVIWPAVSDIPERFQMEISERIKEDVAKARAGEFAESERIIAYAQGCLGEKFEKVHRVTKVGDPLTELLTTAGTSKADLIAVGYRGTRGVLGMMGSVSRNIIGYSKCSVLLGKAVPDR
jgi:nucleotide-binding universal stress UspA family protein